MLCPLDPNKDWPEEELLFLIFGLLFLGGEICLVLHIEMAE
jgi:hypothetical protein